MNQEDASKCLRLKNLPTESAQAHDSKEQRIEEGWGVVISSALSALFCEQAVSRARNINAREFFAIEVIEHVKR